MTATLTSPTLVPASRRTRSAATATGVLTAGHHWTCYLRRYAPCTHHVLVARGQDDLAAGR